VCPCVWCRCPYYLARELQAGAELILVPYIYLLDKDKRSSLANLDLHNAVLIFDEAHNLVCEHAMRHHCLTRTDEPACRR